MILNKKTGEMKIEAKEFQEELCRERFISGRKREVSRSTWERNRLRTKGRPKITARSVGANNLLFFVPESIIPTALSVKYEAQPLVLFAYPVDKSVKTTSNIWRARMREKDQSGKLTLIGNLGQVKRFRSRHFMFVCEKNRFENGIYALK